MRLVDARDAHNSFSLRSSISCLAKTVCSVASSMKAVTEFCLILSCILIFRFCVVYAKSITDPEDLGRLTATSTRKRCIDETDNETSLPAADDTEHGDFLEDDRLKCYFKYALEKFGMMDATGLIKYDLIKQIVPYSFKEIFSEMIDSCTEATGKDNCDKAYNFIECMFGVNPMAFLVP